MQENKTDKKLKCKVYEDDDANFDDHDDLSDEDKDKLFDNVCALCDDGGELLAYASFLLFLTFKMFIDSRSVKKKRLEKFWPFFGMSHFIS